MAFDLKGISPSEYSGEWIRFNVWTWHMIWRASKKLFPNETKDVVFWYTNYGEVVSPETSIALAKSIEQIGIEAFALAASKEDVPIPQNNTSNNVILVSLEYELPAFLAFLKTCNGFRIE